MVNGEDLQWFFSIIADLTGEGLQWGERLQYNTPIKLMGAHLHHLVTILRQ